MIINDFFESDFNKRPKLNEVNPHRFDSDEDYYAALNAPPKTRSSLPRPRGRDVDSYGNDWDEEEKFRASQRRYAAAKKKAEQDADHDRLATGTNEAVGAEKMNEFQMPSVSQLFKPGQTQQATDDTPGNFSIVIAGTMPRDMQASNVKQAIETIFPNDYPRTNWPEEGSLNSPTHHLIQQLVQRGQVVAKDGISSKDVADSLAIKFKKFKVPAYVEGSMNEAVARKVDAKGRTQQQWIQAVYKQFPDARIVQAKMIDGPCHAMLPDGRKLSWTPVEQGMAEAKASTAAFRASNAKRAKLNAMTPEERKAYDKEQAEKQRKRDDARLERERQKLAAKKGMAEDVRLPYPVRSEKLGRANMELLIRAYNEPTGPRTTLSFGDRILELDRQDIEAIAHYYDNVLKDDKARWNFISGVMSDPDGLTNTLMKLGRRKPAAARQPGLFQEADKKKEDDVKDVALQRAITKARSAFPTATSGQEALAKSFMQSQEQDQQDFEKMRQADRRQNELLKQINQVDQNQTQEIDDLEKENSTVLRRLQQLQAVNAKLEKTLASMSGRKTKQSKAADVSTSTSSTPVSISSEPTSEPKKSKKKKGSATKANKPQAISSPQPKIAPPDPQDTPSAMSQVAKQLTTQNPDVLEPAPNFKASAPKFNTTGAQDVVPRDIATDVRQNVNAYGDSMVSDKLQQVANDELTGWSDQGANDDLPLFAKKPAAENKELKSERPEADYGDEYQNMVKRVAQKAKQGPRKTVWDPVKRVYKTVPVNS